MDFRPLYQRSNSVLPNSRQFHLRLKSTAVGRTHVKWFTRYAYYGFVFSLPFEMADLDVAGGLLTLSKFLGYLFVAFALLQPSVCFTKPPKVCWLFVTYLAFCAISGGLLVAANPGNEQLLGTVVSRLFSRVQMLALFWISYNVMRHDDVSKGTLFAISLSTALLVILHFANLTGEETGSRATAFDANPNALATVVSVGLMALFGLSYGRGKTDWKARLLFLATSALLAGTIVRTGSRGAVIALGLSFGTLWFKKGDVTNKLKVLFLALIGIIFLAVVSYQVEAVRERWEKTIYEGSLAGRDVIFTEAWGMFLEKPVLGWGFVNHFYELGARLGVAERDPHNIYLWVLTEVGIIGSLPFLAGLWLCWRAAWTARAGIQGITPLMMMTFLLAGAMKGSWHTRKLFWIILAFTLASSTYTVASRRWRNRSSGSPSVDSRPAYLQTRSLGYRNRFASKN